MRKHIVIIFGGILAINLYASSVYAVMSSATYRIDSDTGDAGGGASGSTTYDSQSSIDSQSGGLTTSDAYKISNGFIQQDDSAMISISPSELTISLSLSGFGPTSGHSDNKYDTVNVKTDSENGYTLAIESANTLPALKCISGGCGVGTDVFDDYVGATPGVPDFTFTLSGIDKSEFGFTVEGSDIVQKFRDNGSTTCNQPDGSDIVSACWLALPAPSAGIDIATSTSANLPDGVDTKVRFQAAVGSHKLQTSGNYQARITATAVVN